MIPPAAMIGRAVRLHQLRDERQRADERVLEAPEEGAAMPTGLGALRAHGVDAERLERLGFVDGGRGADDGDAAGAERVDLRPRRDPEREAD